MNWLDRARREISKSGLRLTANTAKRNLMAVTAVPHERDFPEIDPSNGSNGSSPSGYIPEITPAQLEEFEERAAIMEFDGGLSRSIAEKAAWALVLNGNRALT